MPRPPHLCTCGRIVPHGERCECQRKQDAERKARFDRTRPSSTQRGLGADWRRLRAEHLRLHPMCAHPGCGALATEVDHIVPRRIAPERRLDPTNLQSLCKPCHSRHKQREERRP